MDICYKDGYLLFQPTELLFKGIGTLPTEFIPKCIIVRVVLIIEVILRPAVMVMSMTPLVLQIRQSPIVPLLDAISISIATIVGLIRGFVIGF